jgi:hypothetical protein
VFTGGGSAKHQENGLAGLFIAFLSHKVHFNGN